MRQLVCLMIAALGLCSSASAADPKDALASKLVALLGYGEQYVLFRQQCLETRNSISPEFLVEKDPNYFGGLRPASKQWPKLLSAYGLYIHEICIHPSREEFLGTLASSYAKNMSTDELVSAIQFYSSQSGQSLAAAHLNAQTALYAVISSANATQNVEAMARLRSKVLRMVEENK